VTYNHIFSPVGFIGEETGFLFTLIVELFEYEAGVILGIFGCWKMIPTLALICLFLSFFHFHNIAGFTLNV